MKVIKEKLSTDLKSLELHIFADEHIGDEHCDLARLKERIDYVATHENAYCVLNGDILDYASRSSISDIETRQFNIMEQIQKGVDLFSPIKEIKSSLSQAEITRIEHTGKRALTSLNLLLCKWGLRKSILLPRRFCS